MGYSDWDISGNGTDVRYDNSSISPPLSSGVYGSHCRRLDANGNYRNLAIKNTVASGAFSAISATQALQLEITVRSVIHETWENNFFMGAYTKNVSILGPSSEVGYLLGLYYDGSGGYVVAYLNNGCWYQFYWPGNPGPGPFFGDWQSLRLDVAVSGTTHILKVYSEFATSGPYKPEPGNGNWVQGNTVHGGGNNTDITIVGGNEIHIPNTAPAYAGYNANSRSGVYCGGGSTPAGGMVDGFKITLL
jgi:hypothetical protein